MSICKRSAADRKSLIANIKVQSAVLAESQSRARLKNILVAKADRNRDIQDAIRNDVTVDMRPNVQVYPMLHEERYL